MWRFGEHLKKKFHNSTISSNCRKRTNVVLFFAFYFQRKCKASQLNGHRSCPRKHKHVNGEREPWLAAALQCCVHVPIPCEITPDCWPGGEMKSENNFVVVYSHRLLTQQFRQETCSKTLGTNHLVSLFHQSTALGTYLFCLCLK